jgi:hypothetical protein
VGRDFEIERGRQTDRQTDRQADKQTNRDNIGTKLHSRTLNFRGIVYLSSSDDGAAVLDVENASRI